MEYKPEKIDLIGKRVTIIGGGVIGSSWLALFLASGMEVTLCDPQIGISDAIKKRLNQSLHELKQLGHTYPVDLDKQLFFEQNLSKSVARADYIQESGPEKESFKVELWPQLEASAPAHTLFFSSSSGIVASKQAVKMKQPQRLMIAHPFNPVHLIPLVELVPTPLGLQSCTMIQQALNFYYSIGKTPVLIRKECHDFVANRLQSAIFRESISLVSQGVVNISELDNIVRMALGIRWATGGPFISFHLGGGDGGLNKFIDQLGAGMEETWKQQLNEVVNFDLNTVNLLNQQVKRFYSPTITQQLADFRNEKEIAIIKLLMNNQAVQISNKELPNHD